MHPIVKEALEKQLGLLAEGAKGRNDVILAEITPRMVTVAKELLKMNDAALAQRVKETLEKQLQLLSERSMECNNVFTIRALSGAMVDIARALNEQDT